MMCCIMPRSELCQRSSLVIKIGDRKVDSDHKDMHVNGLRAFSISKVLQGIVQIFKIG